MKRNPPVFQGISVHKSPRGFRYTNPQKIGVLNQKKYASKFVWVQSDLKLRNLELFPGFRGNSVNYGNRRNPSPNLSSRQQDDARCTSRGLPGDLGGREPLQGVDLLPTW